jgi:hypothetical protein
MSGHLSSEDISRWILGERGAAGERHIRECAECAAEIARLEGGLAGFRGAVRRLAAERWGTVPARISQPRQTGLQTWCLRGAAVATLLLAALVPIYRGAHQRRSAAIAQADAQLLEEVDAGVSRSVPRTMEPLLKLIAEDTSSYTDTKKESDNETQQKQ